MIHLIASTCFCIVSTCEIAFSIFFRSVAREELASLLTKSYRLGHVLSELKLTRPLTKPCRLGSYGSCTCADS